MILCDWTLYNFNQNPKPFHPACFFLNIICNTLTLQCHMKFIWMLWCLWLYVIVLCNLYLHRCCWMFAWMTPCLCVPLSARCWRSKVTSSLALWCWGFGLGLHMLALGGRVSMQPTRFTAPWRQRGTAIHLYCYWPNRLALSVGVIVFVARVMDAWVKKHEVHNLGVTGNALQAVFHSLFLLS